MFGNKKEKRFVVKHKEAFEGGMVVIVVDTETGVNYISTIGFGATSFTTLLDANGKPIEINKKKIFTRILLTKQIINLLSKIAPSKEGAIFL